MSEPLIKTTDLSLYYRGKPAFLGVSMPIRTGLITALVGPSGCGKTSFLISLNRLTDLIPHCTVSGSVTVGSKNVLDPKTDLVKLRRRIGKIFQKPNPFPLSVKKNIEFPLREHGMKSKEKLSQSVETALRDVGLWNEVKDRLDSPALTLSGGQQQRLCIARALALKPEALLMDEPCSSLDPISSGVVEELIVKLKGRYTILVVTHNIAQASRIADYAGFFWLKNGTGRLIEYGCAEQLFKNPQEELTASYVQGFRG